MLKIGLYEHQHNKLSLEISLKTTKITVFKGSIYPIFDQVVDQVRAGCTCQIMPVGNTFRYV